jgi:hypothetical protein
MVFKFKIQHVLCTSQVDICGASSQTRQAPVYALVVFVKNGHKKTYSHKKMRGRKLRSGVYWQGRLRQKRVKQVGRKISSTLNLLKPSGNFTYDQV